MELMISTFTLAIAAAISIIIAQAIDKVSVNYISMLVGIIIGLIPFLNSQIASFDSEIFMELIVAPLLSKAKKLEFIILVEELKKLLD